MDISIELVKKLRDKTGAGISDCKRALTEAEGDFEKAIDILRKKGAATSQKRSDRVAKEGIVLAKTTGDKSEAAIIEVNCETDFVARSDAFQKLTNTILDTVLSLKSDDMNVLLPAGTAGGNTVQQALDETTASVGEKVEFKRASYLKSENGFFSAYNHLGNKVASIIQITGEKTEQGVTLGNDLAMQVVAMKPLTIDRSGISSEMIEKEKEIYAIQAKNEGKPDKIAEKIANNRVEKFYEENCLVEQEFVKESGKTVKDVISAVSMETGKEYAVKTMVRYQLGETIVY